MDEVDEVDLVDLVDEVDEVDEVDRGPERGTLWIRHGAFVASTLSTKSASSVLFTFQIGVLLIVLALPRAFAAAGAPSAQEKLATNYALLNEELRSIMAQAPTSARWGVCVREIGSPVVIAQENERESFLPGATQMLLTTSAALDRLGPGYRYRTTLAYTGALANGTVRGDLIVRGGGDPTIGGRLCETPDDPQAVFREWAAELKRCGIASFTGLLILDDTFFDPAPLGPQWPEHEIGGWWTAEVSALSFNENCVGFVCEGGRKAGKIADCRMIPPTDYVLFNNALRTGGRDLKEGYIRTSRQFESNLINLEGFVPRKKEMRARGAVHDPTLFFASVLRKTLAQEEIGIGGRTVKLRDLPSPIAFTSGTCPAVVHVSPPLMDIVEAANRNSQNLYAEAILKTLGKEIRGEGSFKAGAQVVLDFLRSQGLADSSIAVADGSGLSTANAISPRAMADFLDAMTRHSAAAILERSLESAGSGTVLGQRLKRAMEVDPAAPLRITAIPGRRASTSSLAGYAVTAGGQRLAFAFFVSDSALQPAQAEVYLDLMALTLARSELRPDPR